MFDIYYSKLKESVDRTQGIIHKLRVRFLVEVRYKTLFLTYVRYVVNLDLASTRGMRVLSEQDGFEI